MELQVNAVGGESTPGYLRDRQAVRLSVAGAAAGWQATFFVHARSAQGGWSGWRLVATLPAADGGAAVVEWRLRDWEEFNRWAFADFRFEVRFDGGKQRLDLLGKARKGGAERLRSAVWRHYASRVGFYGFGPIGERYSNAELRRVAREVGAAMIQRRGALALRRLAGQVPPDAADLRLYGYSLGGRAALRLARWLRRRGAVVALLVGVDPVDLAAPRLTVPANVRRAVSMYQRNGARLPLLAGPAGRGLPFAAATLGAGETAAVAAMVVENEEIILAPAGWAVMHEDMPYFVRGRLMAFLEAEEKSAVGASAASRRDASH